MPAQAFEPQLGSRNFTPPSSVPNYFSDEAAPFGRGAQTAQPGADRFNTAPAAASGDYAVQSEPSRNTAANAGHATYRGKQARGRGGYGRSASSRTVRAQVRGANVHRANVQRANVGGARGRPAQAHRSTGAASASRQSVATTGRAAGRSSRATRGVGQVRQASR
jgi:hypothetical protein